VIRKRGAGLQVQVYAGRDPLTGRKRYVSQQVPGQTKASMREAKQIEARLLAEVGTGQHKGSRSRTMAELLERWLEWRPTVRPIAPTTVSSYRAGPAAGPSPNYGRWAPRPSPSPWRSVPRRGERCHRTGPGRRGQGAPEALPQGRVAP
jgi:hypothetical protein